MPLCRIAGLASARESSEGASQSPRDADGATFKGGSASGCKRGDRRIGLAGTDPLGRYFQATSDPVGSKQKLNLPAQFIGEQFANDACAVVSLVAGPHARAADLLPLDQAPPVRGPVRTPTPAHPHASGLGGERAVFGGVGD